MILSKFPQLFFLFSSSCMISICYDVLFLLERCPLNYINQLKNTSDSKGNSCFGSVFELSGLSWARSERLVWDEKGEKGKGRDDD